MSKSQKGFCNAIFASSPFDKENKPPGESSIDEDDPPNCKKNLIHFLTPVDPEVIRRGKNDANHRTRRSPTKKNQNLPRSQSHQILSQQDAINQVRKYSSEEKLRGNGKTNNRLSGEKAPVTHFCTPKNGGSSSKKPMRKFFSDNSLPQTPDCFSSVHLETPRAKTEVASDELTVCDGENSNLTVGVRVRPLSFKEIHEPKIYSIVDVRNQNVTVDCEASQHTFMYDHCFMSYQDPSKPGHASQEMVFNTMVLPLVQNAFEGYNVCLFAYGQTGSGKSYSMMGAEPESSEINPEAGIIPRFCRELFSRVGRSEAELNTTVEISYFEIYNEKIHDLLVSNGNTTKRAPLKVREHPAFGPYIVDLSQHSVRNYEDLKAWLKVGNSQRATAATGMNEKSSRSHSIFSIILTQEKRNEGEKKPLENSRRSKINLVDLAGSERLSTTCASGDRLREGVSINKSLLTLGKVIGCLAENTYNRKRGFVPYRESVLTWLLKESLGGNSKTAMLGTVSPANIHLEETLATLRYACQARAIVNRVRINEDPHDRLIRQLKAEIVRLRGMRDGYEKQLGLTPKNLVDAIDSSSDVSEDMLSKQKEIDELKFQLRKMEEQLNTCQKSWQEKLREAEERKNSELTHLRRCGVALELNVREAADQPCLVNLAADPMLSGTLLYLIPAGSVKIGRHKRRGSIVSRAKLDIVLDGPLVREHHCTIENSRGKLTLFPEKDAECFVNGQLVYSKVRLKHGDRLVIGGSHYFKVCSPHDSKDNKPTTAQPVDFDYAHQEILRIQEEKLRAELEESKRKAMKELENAKREVELQLDSQKNLYESKIQELGSDLDAQKRALEEMNSKNRELEHDKEVLVNEIEVHNKIRRLEIEETGNLTTDTYRTNFLQQLEEILNETTADAETALTVKTSIEAMKTGGVSLHEIQLLVREATETCRDVGVNYEFHLQQIIVDKSLRPMIRVRDRDTMKESFWEPMRFLDWIHQLRDHELEMSMKELRDPRDKWDRFEDSEMPQDSMSINLTPVKKQLNESLHQLSVEASFLDNSVDQTTDSVLQKRRDDIHHCLIQMELASQTLKGLCNQYEPKDISVRVAKALEKVNAIMDEVKLTLHEDNRSTMIESSDFTKLSNDESLTEKFEPNLDAPPSKSNLKTACPFARNEADSKSVKFNV